MSPKTQSGCLNAVAKVAVLTVAIGWCTYESSKSSDKETVSGDKKHRPDIAARRGAAKREKAKRAANAPRRLRKDVAEDIGERRGLDWKTTGPTDEILWLRLSPCSHELLRLDIRNDGRAAANRARAVGFKKIGCDDGKRRALLSL